MQSPVVLDLASLEFISFGKSGIVYGIDEERVLKEYHGEEHERDVEREVFARLPSHANIVRYLGATEDGSIVLERGQALRTVIQPSRAHQIPLAQRLCWVRGAANGIQRLHDSGIIHADVGCHNMILVGDCLKIIDFEGCSIDGEEATSGYEWFSYRESTPAISYKTDIFAFGCAIYEILTGRPPHHDLATSNDRRQLVKQRYTENQFPDVSHLPLGSLIRDCWHGAFNSMSEVLHATEAVSLPIMVRY